MRFSLVVAMTALLGACAAPARPPAPPAPVAAAEPAPVAATPINGLYRGTAVFVKRAGKGRCMLPRDARTAVRNGVVTRMWNGVALRAPVQPDGSFNAVGGWGRLSGTVGGGQMNYVIGGEYCAIRFTLSRVDQ